MVVSRAVFHPCGGVDAWGVSPEDVVLSKREWAGESASEQQIQDVPEVRETQYDSPDMVYLRKWAEVLGGAGPSRGTPQKGERGHRVT